MVVDFYERPGCHLCEDALAIVAAECAASGATLQRHDIAADPVLQDLYGELIPVVVINGVQHATWFVDAARLRQALTAGR
ncbi:glutaredoxin family protein [Gulosibacter bifidus]|uniref:Glutaredoxin family protein n=1 Tax=Gulosibacter bifidus TaxID=272239 RepID=A0ABW5RIN7_9MICO|nr:glutaredoxin family protein [Gulosibacter bifidus]